MMTGRDLILYILENHLEDDPIFDNGFILGLMTTNEAAVKFNVGVATIASWHTLGMLPGVKIGDSLYIPVNAEKPKPVAEWKNNTSIEKMIGKNGLKRL